MNRRLMLHLAWNDPVLFFFMATGHRAYHYQEEVLLNNEQLVANLKARDIGMTEVQAVKKLWRGWKGLVRESMIVTTAKRVSSHLNEYCRTGVAKAGLSSEVDRHTDEMLRFNNGSVIHFLPQSAAGNLGFHGDVLIDEAAHMRDGERMHSALFPMTGRGYQYVVSSTPFGQDKLFFPLLTNEDFKVYTYPYTVCPDLVATNPRTGRRRIDIIRRSMSPHQFRQEYECQILSSALSFIGPDTINKCVNPDLLYYVDQISGAKGSDTYLIEQVRRSLTNIKAMRPEQCGWDVGRKQDMSELIFVRFREGKVEKPTLVANLTLDRMPFPVQEWLMGELSDFIPTNIDRGLYGSVILEHARNKGRCRGIQLVPKVMAELAETTKVFFDEFRIEIPDNHELKQHILALQRLPGSQYFKYEADRKVQGHHSDKFWALALAIMPVKRARLNISW